MEYKENQVFKTTNVVGHIHELKILAVFDKWLALKYTGCMPFIKSIKEFPAFLEDVKGELKTKKIK